MHTRERLGRVRCLESHAHADFVEVRRLREQLRLLEAENAVLGRQAGEVESLRRELETARARIRELEAALVEARRSQHRQTAPFRRDEKAKDRPSPEPANLTGQPASGGPKRPGRKSGHPAANRPRLKPDHFHPNLFPRDREGKPSCPGCGAWLVDLRRRLQQVVDLPEPGDRSRTSPWRRRPVRSARWTSRP